MIKVWNIDLVECNVRVYLDNCCFNRPFDSQASVVVKLETEAKLYIQEAVKNNIIELAWSFILDYENSLNPYLLKRKSIEPWRSIAIIDVDKSEKILLMAECFVEKKLKVQDALHIASAIAGLCDFFITTDKGILKKRSVIKEIKIINPVEFWEQVEDTGNEK